MNRSLKLSMLIALALGSGQAMALDLGQIQVKSALGQPLLAEIPLHPDNPAELQNLRVQLASSEDFARAGIVGGRTSIPLHFSVVNASDGKVIRITSSVAVDDPFLDLLLEVDGNAGKSVREFTILLDPPDAQPAAPVATTPPTPPAQRRPTRAAPAAPVARQAPAVTPRQARPAAPVAGSGHYGPVERGQTLSGIARSTAPAGVDVQQMMLALKQANPDAFYRDNINALKSGAVLRVPTSAEAQAMTLAAAAAEVRRQNGDWRAGTPGQPAVVADAATRTPASTADNTSGDTSDRLALVPAKGEGNAGSAAGKGDATGSRQDLLRAQESLASLQQQSTDLKARLKDLADINQKNERLLSLKDNEIAELQAKLAEARKAAGMPVAATPTTEAVKPAPAGSAASTAETQPEADLETATASTTGNASQIPVAAGSSAAPIVPVSAASTSTATTPAATPVAPAPVKPAAKPVTKAAPAPVVAEPWYMQTWAWAAAGGAVLLLLLLALLGRRRKPAATGASKAAASSLADRFGAPASDQDLLAGDDVDQEELLDQLAEHPDDIGLHLELVTLYYSRRDVEHFEAAAEAMHAHVTDPQQDEWQDVLHMGEDLVPGHPLFAGQADLPASEEAEARSEFNIDDYAEEADAPTVVSPMPPLPGSPKKVSEYNFNFDLTRPVAAEPISAPPSTMDDDITIVAPLVQPREASEEPAAEATSSWHFDGTESTPATDDPGLAEFNDDPVDTKLDLARAYLDMGDADGARAMLDEVIKEGSQMQQDVARRLLENLH